MHTSTLIIGTKSVSSHCLQYYEFFAPVENYNKKSWSVTIKQSRLSLGPKATYPKCYDYQCYTVTSLLHGYSRYRVTLMLLGYIHVARLHPWCTVSSMLLTGTVKSAIVRLLDLFDHIFMYNLKCLFSNCWLFYNTGPQSHIRQHERHWTEMMPYYRCVCASSRCLV